MKRCCPKCLGDEAIREFIQGKGILGDCDYCRGSGGPGASAAEVGSFVVAALLRAFEPSPDGHSGSSASIVLKDESDMDDKALKAGLSVDLIENASGGAAYRLSSHELLLHKKVLAQHSYPGLDDYESAWLDFKSTVMCDARFFDIKQSRQGLIESLTPLLERLMSPLEHGEAVYRGQLPRRGERLPKNQLAIQDRLGPPPNSVARHNRMSPAGISYCYVSNDETTCVAEIQPNVGREVWVGRFPVLRDIRLIDFSKEYDWRIDDAKRLRNAKGFLDEFKEEISQPTRSKDNLLEYVPIQVLAEHIRTLGFEGIAYGSAQYPDRKSYTLFCGPPNNPLSTLRHSRPVYDQWLRLVEVYTLEIVRMKLDTQHRNRIEIGPEQLKRPDPFEGPKATINRG